MIREKFEERERERVQKYIYLYLNEGTSFILTIFILNFNWL